VPSSQKRLERSNVLSDVKNGLTIVLTGASGYVGQLILHDLVEVADEVRCMTRRPESLDPILPEGAIAVKGDTFEPVSLDVVLEGATVAYYLVHSLGESGDFADLEATSARNFGQAAKRAGVKRIVYLGGLAQKSTSNDASGHMASRHKVGVILRESGVPVTEFRASTIIGAGSMPFEAVRALVERLPIMVTPKWVREELQPISARDMRKYLITGIQDQPGSHIYEIGGADIVRYQDIMRMYARVRGLRRIMVPVPVITPRLSSHWLRLVTPAHYRIGRRIVESSVHKSIVIDDSAKRFNIECLDTETAIRIAMEDEDNDLKFLDLYPNSKGFKTQEGTRFLERRVVKANVEMNQAAKIAKSVGGQNGWFWGNSLWRIRGFIDRIVGGVGYRKGRPEGELSEGDLVDFWTVRRVSPDRLTLSADMRLPGEALLDFKIREADKSVYIDMTVSFNPRGWIGYAYWFALYPIHALVFNKMMSSLERRVASSLVEDIIPL